MTNEEIIKEIVERLKKVPEVKKIIVFGSRARGDYSEESDIDLLVIGDFKGRIIDRQVRLDQKLRDIHEKVAIDLFPLSDDEIKTLIDAGSLFWKEVLQTGITVYETI
ncbi:MAG: nucleotidyltransferase domain-containing protein [Candidatus Hydrothermota bacterium]|nr:MAG: nucleotidyltransferase domain-containing protein [Candidatus Hydrothermae bacterium]